MPHYHVVFLLCLSAEQIYSNNFEVATLPQPDQLHLHTTGCGTLYLISVGAFTDGGEGEREEQVIKMDSSTEIASGMYDTHHLRYLHVYARMYVSIAD